MTIAITTPTGNVGRRLARLLVGAGHRPVLLARDGSGVEAEVAAAAEIREGDLGDTDYVRSATAGVDALYWVDPTDLTVEDPNAQTARLGRNAADAVRANGIARVVFQSSGGAELRHGAGLIDGLAAVEQLLDDSGAAVTHLRCGYFFTNVLMDLDGLRAGRMQTSMTPDRALPWVHPYDVAVTAALRLLDPTWSGRVVRGVHGPEDLSFRQVADILSEVIGRPVELEEVRDEQVREGLVAAGLSADAAAQVTGMTSGLRDGYTPEQPRDVTSTTPSTFRAFGYDEVRPLLTG